MAASGRRKFESCCRKWLLWCWLISLRASVSGWQALDFHLQMEWLPVEVQGNRRRADRWLGRDIKHGLTSDDKSITAGDMKYAHATPDVYEHAGLTTRQRDWLNDPFACVCVCVCDAHWYTHTNTALSFWLKASGCWAEITSLKLKISWTQGTSPSSSSSSSSLSLLQESSSISRRHDAHWELLSGHGFHFLMWTYYKPPVDSAHRNTHTYTLTYKGFTSKSSSHCRASNVSVHYLMDKRSR